MPRFHCPDALATGRALRLPPGAARHAQVLRLQPGDGVTLFDGRGGEYDAVIEHMGRVEVGVRVGEHHALEREARREVHLAVGMPANDRMDWLVEKATELGVASIQPLITQRSVLRLVGERAAKKQSHWQAVAVAACEQCGRNRVPVIHDVQPFSDWLGHLRAPGLRLLLSTRPQSIPLAPALAQGAPVLVLSGAEGGWSGAEEEEALVRGFAPTDLGPRILRAETAPLAALVALTLAA
jgi:16S rRNA (uracil1498-N3)-methyltransferase